jgi:hypothetical protein
MPLKATVTDVAAFLSHLFYDKQLQYSTINGYRSTISTVLGIIRNDFVGQHELISRLMKGIERKSPRKAKYQNFWDPGVVLKYVAEWGDNQVLTNEKLTKKLIATIRLALFLRSSDMARILRKEIRIGESGVVLGFDVKKEQKQGREMKTMDLPCLVEEERICPVKTLEEYLRRTESWTTGTEDSRKCLVLALNDQCKSLSAERIAKLMLEVMMGMAESCIQ